MTDGDSKLTRRKALKGLTGAAGVALVGGTGLAAFAGGASATAGGTIEDPQAATSDDGKITYVAVKSTGRVNWDGFDKPVTHARIVNKVTINTDGMSPETYEIHDTGKFELSENWGGDGEAVELAGDHKSGQEGFIASDTDWGIAQRGRDSNYNNGYALPENPAPVKDMFAASDGSTRETTVTLKATYILYGSSGELTGTNGYPERPHFENSFTVTVNNQAASTSGGDKDGDGDTDDSANVGV